MNGRNLPGWLTVGAATLLFGCAAYRLPEGTTAPAVMPEIERVAQPAEPTLGEQVVALATTKLGAPYRYGARGPDAFDCSGLVYYSYQAAGLTVPRTAAQQHRVASPVPMAKARRGDLLFFSNGGRISHVGIYLGGKRFVHAPASGRPVTISYLDEEWYHQHFAGAGRLF